MSLQLPRGNSGLTTAAIDCCQVLGIRFGIRGIVDESCAPVTLTKANTEGIHLTGKHNVLHTVDHRCCLQQHGELMRCERVFVRALPYNVCCNLTFGRHARFETSTKWTVNESYCCAGHTHEGHAWA